MYHNQAGIPRHRSHQCLHRIHIGCSSHQIQNQYKWCHRYLDRRDRLPTLGQSALSWQKAAFPCWMSRQRPKPVQGQSEEGTNSQNRTRPHPKTNSEHEMKLQQNRRQKTKQTRPQEGKRQNSTGIRRRSKNQCFHSSQRRCNTARNQSLRKSYRRWLGHKDHLVRRRLKGKS